MTWAGPRPTLRSVLNPPSRPNSSALECRATVGSSHSKRPRGSRIMRNGVLALLMLVGAATASRAEAWAEKMFKDAPAHNFRTVPHGAQLFHSFTLTNI